MPTTERDDLDARTLTARIAYPTDLVLRERELWRIRDQHSKAPADQHSEEHADQRLSIPSVGFGLSGGGIRSATFCLGVFQALARSPGLLRKIDYISSVSGGGFFAAFYGRMFSRPDIESTVETENRRNAGVEPNKLTEIEKILSPDHNVQRDFPNPVDRWKTEVFQWLRENGRYLAPNGSGDLLLAITVFLRNWVTVQLLLSVSLLALFLLSQLTRFGLRSLAQRLDVTTARMSALGNWFWISPFVYVAVAMGLFLVLPLAWGYWTFALPDPGTVNTGTVTTPAPGTKTRGPTRISIILEWISTNWLRLNVGFRTMWQGLLSLLALALLLLAAGIVAYRVFSPPVGILRVGSIVIVEITFLCWQIALLRSQPTPGFWHYLFFSLTALCSIGLGYAAGGYGRETLSLPIFIFLAFLLLPTCTLMVSEDAKQLIDQSEMARTKISKWLELIFIATLAVFAFAILDSVGQSLFALKFTNRFRPSHWLIAIIGGIAGVVPFANSIKGFFTFKKGLGPSLPLSLLAAVGAFLIYLPFLVSLDGFSHAIAYNFAAPSDAPPRLTASYAKPQVATSAKPQVTASGNSKTSPPAGASITKYDSPSNPLPGSTNAPSTGPNATPGPLIEHSSPPNAPLGAPNALSARPNATLGPSNARPSPSNARAAASNAPPSPSNLCSVASNACPSPSNVCAGPSNACACPQSGIPAASVHANLRSCRLVLGFLILAVLYSIVTGSFNSKMAWVFVNRTSLHPLYCARLIRAYLGASNKDRHLAGDDSSAGVSDPIDGDDIAQEEYWRPSKDRFWKAGAPLHLVNVTINETIDGRSQIEQRDRKGVGMAIGPAAFSVGVQHHIVFMSKRSQPSTPDQPPIARQALIDDQAPLADHAPIDGQPSTPDQPPIANQTPPPDPAQTLDPAQTPEFAVFPQDPDAFRVFNMRKAFRFLGRKKKEADSFKGQQLSLGNWTAISGAAVSTGLGSRNSLGASLLTGFFNVRLGYWWDSGTRSLASGHKLTQWVGWFFAWLLPVQSSFLDEFLGRFHGTARQYWYLSDGGHFEDLGGYELIRRRLPVIVLIDAAADPDYDFEELANLIRKARLDFNAEINFVDPDTSKHAFDRAMAEVAKHFQPIEKKFFGTLDQLRRGKWAAEPVPSGPTRNAFFKSSIPTRLSVRHAALAKVTYLDDPDAISYLILLKPTLIGEEPQDLTNYHSANPAFPQQSTAEQFFDEAQWESYRRLGQHIAEKIFHVSNPS